MALIALQILLLMVVLGFAVYFSVEEDSMYPYVLTCIALYLLIMIGMWVKEDVKEKEKSNKHNIIQLEKNKEYVIIRKEKID